MQSPGITEIVKTGKALLIVAAMISVNSCNSGQSGLDPDQEIETLNLNNEFKSELDTIVNSYNNLDVPTDSRHYYKQ